MIPEAGGTKERGSKQTIIEWNDQETEKKK